jgi:hypothetical protein
MQYVNIGFLTPYSLTSKKVGRRFFTLISDLLPNLLPEQYNNYEPINKKFSLEKIEEVLESWENPFLWKRRKPKVLGMTWMKGNNVHPSTYIDINCTNTEFQSIDAEKWVNLFQQVSLFTKVDFSYLHLFTQTEFDMENYDASMPFRQGISTHQLRKYLPNLTWATVFGAPYVELFGREKVLSAPAFLVQEMHENIFYVQLSENFSDFKSQYQEINTTRQAVKKHLGVNAFFDPEASESQIYKVPSFSLDLGLSPLNF